MANRDFRGIGEETLLVEERFVNSESFANDAVSFPLMGGAPMEKGNKRFLRRGNSMNGLDDAADARLAKAFGLLDVGTAKLCEGARYDETGPWLWRRIELGPEARIGRRCR